jgi:hypothetical protein
VLQVYQPPYAWTDINPLLLQGSSEAVNEGSQT